ncbi:MAG: TetR family transcriptional regulator [Rhodospirillaceae bacterium]|nr:MAG: TetR family transcriptional regulator [Rhodospirillaceae bacterium]
MEAEALGEVSAGMTDKKAKKTKKAKTAKKTGTRDGRKNQDRVVAEAALDLAAERGWRNVSLHDIALRTNVSLSELYKNYLSKESILDRFMRAIDEEVLRGLDEEDAEETPRDRLFDILMRRFDALAPYKKGIAAVLKDVICDPTALGLGACRYFLSMTWMLEGAGISTAGLHGMLRVKGLSILYFAVLQVWLDDSAEDQGKTMAALDRWLKRAEKIETQFPWPERAASES